MKGNDNIGRSIGRYQLLGEIGRGGMATVYKALDTALGREVALKLLHPHLASDSESRKRFQREAQAVARLKHDSVVEIYDYSGEEGEEFFIVMELVEGTTLRKFLDSRQGEPLPSEAVALIFLQVCSGLAHAHAHGMIHRDVKPENILIGPRGEIKLSDFGIAHMAGMSQMTITGQMLGSPSYMSPEHVEMTELDFRADIFSIGIVLYEAAVGRLPFEGKNPHAVLKKIVEGHYADPMTANPRIGFHLAQAVRHCLKKAPSERYSQVEELLADLNAFLITMEIEPSKEVLVGFLEAPDEWNARETNRIVQRTMALGLAARRGKRHSEAMDHFNRILALTPGHEKALEAVAGMHRLQMVRIWLERSAVVASAVIVISGVAWAVVHDDDIAVFTPKAEMVPADSVLLVPEKLDAPSALPADTGAAVSTDTTVKERPSESKTKSKKHVRPGLSPAAPPKLREVIFMPRPLAVEVVIDGKQRFPFGPANRSTKLPVGKHTISFIPNDKAHLAEYTEKVYIDDTAGPYNFGHPLAWRPAKLLVQCNVDAVVTVPGRAIDKVNKPFAMEIDKNSEAPSEEVSVLVSREGYIPETKKVTITAGELVKTRIDLKEKPGSQ